MRKIKFRGYATEELTGSQWVTIGYGVTKIDYTDGTSSVHLLTPYGAYSIEKGSEGQYTGINDVSGKEIFEKDILKYNTQTFIIEWDKELASFVAKDVITNEFLPTNLWKEAKISGNIYEKI